MIQSGWNKHKFKENLEPREIIEKLTFSGPKWQKSKRNKRRKNNYEGGLKINRLTVIEMKKNKYYYFSFSTYSSSTLIHFSYIFINSILPSKKVEINDFIDCLKIIFTQLLFHF